MTVPEKAVEWAIKIANDQTHGYSQSSRWGSPDYDCSSFAISSYRTGAGVPIDIRIVNYTGNMTGLLSYGFKDVSKNVNFNNASGMQKGDIVYYHKSGNIGHAVLYIGNGKIVHARGQSYGSSKPGDQGTEIAVTNYYKGSFDRCYRYVGSNTVTTPAPAPAPVVKRYAVNVSLPIIKMGSKGRLVKVWQTVIGVENDGEFGPYTHNATIALQRSAGIEVDGEVGPVTWGVGLNNLQ